MAKGGDQIAMLFRFHWTHLKEKYNRCILNYQFYNTQEIKSYATI